MSGTLAVHVEARDSNGNVTASGDGSGSIRVGGRADVGVSLAVIDQSGDMGETMGGDMALRPGSDMAKPPGDMVVVPPAMLTIDKPSQSFGDITVGKTSTTASFLVINAGGMASSVATLSTGGANIGEFSVDTDCGPSLRAGRPLPRDGVDHADVRRNEERHVHADGGARRQRRRHADGERAHTGRRQDRAVERQLRFIAPRRAERDDRQLHRAEHRRVTDDSAQRDMSDAQFVATGCSGMTLAAGAMCTVTVKFTPTASGTQNASLTVSAATGGTDTASVVGVGLKPAALSVAPPSYTFASVARGTTSAETATFTVSNGGDVASASMSPATLGGANPSSFAIMSDGCKGAPVGPAPATCSIVVQFMPQASGGNNASLSIAAGSSTVGTPSLSGVGLNPASLKLTPSTMTTFTKGQTATFTVTNDGEVASGALSAAMLTGTNAASFAISANNCNGKSIGPSPASCTIDVKFAPTTTGSQTATISLAGTPGGSLSATLGGPGLNPAALAMSPAMPTFTKGQTVTFTVSNSGEIASGTLGAPTLGGTNAASFSIAANGCNGKSVGPSPASCTIDVKFAPTTTGTQSATLSVAASPGGTASSTLGGPGLNPASLRLSPDHYTFNTVPRGSTGDTTTFTVTNDGEVGAPALSAATLTGNTSSFTVADGCQGKALGPSPANCTISVQFTPALSGTNSALMTVKAGSTTVGTANLSGTATPIWVAETLPANTPKLSAVWATDPNNVYAVGSAGTILYRGNTGVWATESLTGSTPPDFTAVSGSTSTNIFAAAGEVYQSGGDGQWSSMLTSGPFTGVWAFSSADVWATWDTGVNDPNSGNAVYQYTPSAGWKLARDAGGNTLHGSTSIWGTSSSDLFIYGGYLRFEISINAFVTGGNIFHLDGVGNFATQFSQSKQVVPQDVSMAVRSLWGSGSPANNLYAVTTVFSGSNHSEAILHATSGVWDQMPTPAPTVSCDAVWGYDASHVLFGCADGVHQYDGTTWTSALSSTSHFYGLSGSNINTPNVFAVGATSDGANGVVYHYY